MTTGKIVTVRDLILELQEATRHMSVTNPNRALLTRCGKTILELAIRTQTAHDEPIFHYVVETVQ